MFSLLLAINCCMSRKYAFYVPFTVSFLVPFTVGEGCMDGVGRGGGA